MATTGRKTDSDYSKKYAEKRKGVKFTLEFYLDDELEKKLYDNLKAEPRGSAKKLILELLENHYRSSAD